ncbi:MAG: peptidoglycan DD-metalloendopeptidase family protein [Ruminococcus flavefaciens]|nr:peptidoglycan DD-metalloendopeptidase family protein [Ruminococcus flavefaciens]MCM1228602.1 peptidoglycan DD-metalloendopeptidase family protein [Ruminococcus flavefaciens]
MINILKKSASVLSVAVLALSVCNTAGLSACASNNALWPLDDIYTDISTYFDESRNYGNSSAHNAIDLPADYGANIYAVCDGECVSAQWHDSYGYLIILWHEELNLYTFYAHCSAMNVYSGQTVNKGDVIGYVGNTGLSYGSHLHFGICDTLLGGAPYVTYYDPLTCFTYDDSKSNVPDDCACSNSYAGVYTTYGVDTYLNIRNGHSTDSEVVGSIPPGSEILVTKSDGIWAHIEYNGTVGCCAMEYLQKTGSLSSDMTISGANVPQGTFDVGAKFGIKGVINSQLPLERVWGGVYRCDGSTPVVIAEKNPHSLSYDLSGEFDRQITFNSLGAGSYIYKVEAEDEAGQKFTLISSVFYVGENNSEKTGDINADGDVNIADLVLLQKYLLNGDAFTAEQYASADINRDSVVDVFDMVDMRQKVYERMM